MARRIHALDGQQQSLFEDDTPSNEPVEFSDLVAHVVFGRPLREVFHYRVPAVLATSLCAGKRVAAPFGKGNRKLVGFCVEVSSGANSLQELKSIDAVIDEVPLLSEEMLGLTRWMADYYFASWGQVLEAVVPAAVKEARGQKLITMLSPANVDQATIDSLPAKQKLVFETLLGLGRAAETKEIARLARCSLQTIRALLARGVLIARKVRVHQAEPAQKPVAWRPSLVLNDAQQRACRAIVAAIDEERHEVFLLHGVTGSGKTEVYLHCVREVVGRGREAIILVPEISLTPQTIQRFRERYDNVAVLHSHLSDVDRHWYWKQIAGGEVEVIVGARSALFAPCRRLGLIVIDEEHETTFKQETTPRYLARDVAIERARRDRIPLILGSATPSLEAWRRAREGRYRLLSLPDRVGDKPMPVVEIIDLRREYQAVRSLRAISRPLEQAMRATLAAGGQVILLLNRRGYFTTVMCPLCGDVMHCKRCDIVLTYHKVKTALLCHSCDSEYSVPERCSKCGSKAIYFSGMGTERLENEVKQRFPTYRAARMDSDTMRTPRHYEQTLEAFRHGELQILLGTQMIAKGLDFPEVHLVGVISADTSRNLPDFRAAERTFQLIAQVAGRTGRGRLAGRVLVQTFNPDDWSIKAAAAHNFEAFAELELPVRERFGYPPYSTLTRVIVRSKNLEAARKTAEDLADRLRQQGQSDRQTRILGPAPAPIAKLMDMHRFHFQLQTSDHDARRRILEAALGDYQPPAKVEIVVDVDPTYMQ